MKAFKIGKYIVAADLIEDVKNFLIHEMNVELQGEIEEVDLREVVACEDGRTVTIKEIINEKLDNRQTWQRLGLHCETYRPFLITIRG